ncbi:RNA 2',3'-cyclic phosphodiesterase [Nocardioides marmorisolisilvae]|uniref:RNA 2',3'-cyclic phosphodiesterase n=1 Tax=Nocardioides marmorisolisilvae TaxID=1542737 RepID=A0A3N0DII2_9ACTN|nr:RNA 2',3'-cyclic phosphodiesterase [Nocardioides marmorisolisilvae]RNL75494.1 RNA 2',3'-cyclic phosphodiesterase [Nocardioides marmorisolisilvae]
MTQRMFVAALPPENVVEDLDEFLAVRRDADRGLRWAAPEQWHLTLAFLPAVAERVYDDLCDRFVRAARKRAPMTLALAGGGAFPNPGRAKVLWARVEVDDRVELDRLATGCRAAATKAGVAVPGERFTPHLTLARAARPFEATRWLRVLEAYRSPEFALDEVALIASHLGEGARGRPRYEVLQRFALGNFRADADPKPDLDHS